jgi:DUF1680 family protein
LPASTYVELARTWKTGDVVELLIPKDLRLETTPDDTSLAAVMWGPLVLANDLGTTPPSRGARGSIATNVPVVVTSPKDVAEWLKPVPGRPGAFHAQAVGRTAAAPETQVDLDFVPLYQLHDHTYSVYMSIYTPETWAAKRAGAR